MNWAKLGKSPNFCSGIHGEFDEDEWNFGCRGQIGTYTRMKLAIVKLITEIQWWLRK
jgi:hypothetical protein